MRIKNAFKKSNLKHIKLNKTGDDIYLFSFRGIILFIASNPEEYYSDPEYNLMYKLFKIEPGTLDQDGLIYEGQSVTYSLNYKIRDD